MLSLQTLSAVVLSVAISSGTSFMASGHTLVAVIGFSLLASLGGTFIIDFICESIGVVPRFGHCRDHVRETGNLDEQAVASLWSEGQRILDGKLNTCSNVELKAVVELILVGSSIGNPTKFLMKEFILLKHTTTDAQLYDLFHASTRTGQTVPLSAFVDKYECELFLGRIKAI